jgi:glucose/arabinose dehydrogenase
VIARRALAVGVVGALALLGACASGAWGAGAEPVSPSPLKFPAAFAVTPHGARILYGERLTGRLRWLDPDTGAARTFFTVRGVTAGGEQGLLGIALRRSYPDDRRVWAYVTRTVSGTPRNQLIRIRADGSGFKVLRDFPAAPAHDGGRIAFGPDGKLYVVVGDTTVPARAQSLTSPAGKLLRLNPDGTVPSDNPRPASPVVGYGIRNSFGFAFDPQTGRIWETENGPECNDEINLIARLRLQNFAWGPSETCSSPPAPPLNTNQDGPSRLLPKLYFPTPPALTGAAFCTRCGLGASGRLFFGSYNTGIIRRAALDSTRTGIASMAPYYQHSGPVISLETPLLGGPIYFSTPSNIFRLSP